MKLDNLGITADLFLVERENQSLSVRTYNLSNKQQRVISLEGVFDIGLVYLNTHIVSAYRVLTHDSKYWQIDVRSLPKNSTNALTYGSFIAHLPEIVMVGDLVKIFETEIMNSPDFIKNQVRIKNVFKHIYTEINRWS